MASERGSTFPAQRTSPRIELPREGRRFLQPSVLAEAAAGQRPVTGAASARRRGKAAFRSALAAALLVALGGALAPLRAAEAPLTQYQVQAAFLYHFTKYVTWPPHAFSRPDEPLVIGVLGDDPFGDDLTNAIARERSAQGRPLRIVRAHNIGEVLRCHILFISGSEAGRLAQHFAALQRARSPALTVGESDDFLSAGGVVRFVTEQNKVRFDINAANAERAGLAISSKLLSLARNTRSRG